MRLQRVIQTHGFVELLKESLAAIGVLFLSEALVYNFERAYFLDHAIDAVAVRAGLDLFCAVYHLLIEGFLLQYIRLGPHLAKKKSTHIIRQLDATAVLADHLQ